MPLLHIIILAIVQGLTEFLPISSSGHLVLTHMALDGNTQTPQNWDTHIFMDVAVHVGTLLAVLLYCHKEVINMLKGVIALLTGNLDHAGTQMGLKLVVSSIPVIIAGFILNAFQPSWLLAIEITAWTTLIFGVILWIADRTAITKTEIETLSYKEALIIGLSQVLALIPGTSRSGITMTTSRFLGYDRIQSAKYSLLLGIIAISGAGTLGGIELLQETHLNSDMIFNVMTAVMLSFIAGWVSIALMMKYLSHANFTPFALYRVILGIGLLILIYTTDFL